MSRHRVFQEELVAEVGDVVVIGGDEAHHAARVKRLIAGDVVEVLNGAGLVVDGRVDEVRKKPRGDGWEIVVRVVAVRVVEKESPRIEVWSAVPKGDRLEQMIDQLAQVGVAEWSPLEAARSVVDPREGKLQRVERRAAEASKQSGRPWVMTMGVGGTLEAALADPSVRVVLADASGLAYQRQSASHIRVLVGPEGGWEESELSRARSAGAMVAAFGGHVMRLETAAVVAAAIVREVQDSPLKGR
jgi:16S rRNA (uracil1498-N3)-methyltransferase